MDITPSQENVLQSLIQDGDRVQSPNESFDIITPSQENTVQALINDGDWSESSEVC